MAIRVALGEDSLIVREGIQQLLAVDPEVESSPRSGISLRCARRARASTRTWSSPTSGCRRPTPTRASGSAAELRETHPEIGVVILSQFADPIYALALLERRLRRAAPTCSRSACTTGPS